MQLWGYRQRGWAQRAWMRWYSWAIRSGSSTPPAATAARDRFRTAIYFHLGGLDLYPAGFMSAPHTRT
jgi:hypothetical protein